MYLLTNPFHPSHWMFFHLKNHSTVSLSIPLGDSVFFCAYLKQFSQSCPQMWTKTREWLRWPLYAMCLQSTLYFLLFPAPSLWHRVLTQLLTNGFYWKPRGVRISGVGWGGEKTKGRPWSLAVISAANCKTVTGYTDGNMLSPCVTWDYWSQEQLTIN